MESPTKATIENSKQLGAAVSPATSHHGSRIFISSSSSPRHSLSLPLPPSASVTLVNSDSTTKQESRFSQWMRVWVTDWWGAEIAGWIIAALSLVSIVIVLESHKSKPLPEWPFKLTLNSLISILATISEMAMMKPIVECVSQLKWLWFIRKNSRSLGDFQAFDDASRGPTGSLLLLGKIRGLHLVSLGAAIAVLSTVFGAFAQQVVTYPLLQRPGGDATLPLALNFTGAASVGAIVLPDVNAALYTGLSKNTSTLSDVTPDCSTENCTWQSYPSLGVCADVVDLSTKISSNACNLTAFNDIFETPGLTNPGYPCFNYSLPFQAGDYILEGADDVFRYGNITFSNAVPLNPDDYPSSMLILDLPTTAGTSNSSLFTSYLMYQPNFSITNLSLPSPIAYGLSLGLCVQIYNTTVSNGRTQTSVISSQILEKEELNTELSDGTFSFTTNGSFPALAVDGFDFGVTAIGVDLLFTTLQNFFAGSCYQLLNATDSEIYTTQDGDAFCPYEITSSLLDGMKSPQPFQAVEGLMQNIATSMTNTFRTGSGGDVQTIQFIGTALSPQTYVGTNYAWLVFPIALVLLSLVFLLATISKSQRLGSRVWKSSNMATLQGLHKDITIGGLTSISEMNEKGKLLRVRLNMEGKAERDVEYSLVESKRQEHWKG